ncbi:KH domain-containing protein At4g18375-like isoform X1 [Primulina huaijiensis]|uniref:KH domain-containing protein At4g18375-like isoform X1 n=1 Tax=Primulina huaijiensis TaxID=1492673 RepID=UPI003CC6EBF6
MEGNRRKFLNKHSNPQFKRKGVPSGERRHNFPLERLSGNSDLLDTVYRILCFSKKIGSVIGKGGKIVKALREETQATITVTDSIPGSDERVITICSPSDKPANIQKIKNGDTSGKGDDVMEPHCAAQDALLRVHDRIVKEDLGGVESSNRDDLVVTARLLVSNSTVGCLLGKKGDVIQRLRSETGADIRVSPADHLPVCANSNEELVQISGTPDIAKKALYEVSTRLHQNPRKDKPSLSFSSPYARQSFHPSGLEERNMLRSGDFSWSEPNADVYNLSPLPWRGGHVTRPSKFGHEDLDGISTPRDQETLSEFSMKILCSAEKIGGVIGKGGLNVKLLERETGASVCVENVSKESDERVIRVFSLEALSDQRSQTIDAIIQLQNKTCQLSEKGTVTTRLLVPSSKVGCILGQGGSIINEMRRRTQADIRVLSKEDKPKCAFDDEELVQICGSFGVARDALTEISLRLRTRCLRDATALVEPAPVRPIPRFNSARNLRGGLPRPTPIGAGSSGRYKHMTGGFRDHESPSYPAPPWASSYSVINEGNIIFGGRHDVEFAGTTRAKFHDPYFTSPDFGSSEQFNASRHIPDFGSSEQFNASRRMHQMHTSSAGPNNYPQSGAYQSYNSPHGVYLNVSSHIPYQNSNPPSVAYQNIHTQQGSYQNTSAEGSYYY